jgi:MFS family permease
VVALTVTLATFMELLDTSIANVSLPYIGGGLGRSFDEVTWILTTYLVANAVVLPMSAWLSRVFGRKNYYMACVALFTVASLFCGLAPTLGIMLAARVFQGIGGGGLAPVEQAILVDTFPPNKRALAFAGHRTRTWGMDYRQLQLALGLFYQYSHRRPVSFPHQSLRARSTRFRPGKEDRAFRRRQA